MDHGSTSRSYHAQIQTSTFLIIGTVNYGASGYASGHASAVASAK